MVSKIKSVSKVDALVAIRLVVGGERREDSKLNLRGISVFLHGADDFDGDLGLALTVVCSDDFAKGALAK